MTEMDRSEEKKAQESIKEADKETDKETGKQPADNAKKENEWKHLAGYFLLYFLILLYWEFLLRLEVSGMPKLRNLTLLFFLPSVALAVCILSGWHRKHTLINGIVRSLLLLLLAVYYFAQVIYHRVFTSLFSVSMAGMGTEALGNFGWTIVGTLKASVGYLVLILLPVLFSVIFCIIKVKGKRILPGGYSPIKHLLVFCAAVAFWFVGVFGIRCLGTDRSSAYYVYKNPLSDTDTTAERLGAIPTSVIEAASFYLGIGIPSNVNDLQTVNTDALLLGSSSVSGDAVNTEETVSETAAEESESVSENAPQPVIWMDEAIDLKLLGEQAEDEQIRGLCEYYNSKLPTQENEYTGLFEGYNLICICAEAFSNYGIDPEVTPTLWKMANNGIVLNNFYNSYPNTTTNGEFSFLTGLWPDVSRTADRGTAVGTFPQSANLFMPYGMGDFFAREGVSTYAYHNYYGDYYKRRYSWPNVGYETIKFMDDGMQFSSIWPASDLEMMQQSLEDYVEQDRFHAYYMTFSGHGPYATFNVMYQRNNSDVRALLNGKYTDIASVAYFCGERELDKAMEYTLNRLEEAGKLENTVIVLIGDHYPYQLPDSARVELNGGEPLDTVFEQYHSTCIIYNAALETPICTDNYCCNVDILPTLLNLFNITYDSRLLAGTDIFSEGIHRARLYNGTFLTDYVHYDAHTGEAHWQEAAEEYSEEELAAYLEAMCEYTENEYSSSLQLLKSNFYFYLWANAGLLTPEEAEAELAREAAGETVYENEAAAAAALENASQIGETQEATENTETQESVENTGEDTQMQENAEGSDAEMQETTDVTVQENAENTEGTANEP